MSSPPQNVYERIIQKTLNERDMTSCPRILVKRQSFLPSLPLMLQGSVLGDFQQSDISSCFIVTTRWDQSKAQSEVELDQTRFSELPLHSRLRMVFSFSSVVPACNGFAFYGTVDCGFLAGHSYLCGFAGTFEQPVNYDLTILRYS